MNNKVFGLTAAAITSSALLFFGVANAGSMAADKWLFPTEQFGSNTYIGTTDVSNMEVTEAEKLFFGKVESWRSTAELLVTYQDATASYPLDNAEILLDETMGRAETGSQNDFIFQLSPDSTRTFLEQQFPVALFSDLDIAAITDKLETALQSGQTTTRVAISDDSLSIERGTLAAVSWQHSLESTGVNKVIDGLNGYEIAPGEQFSFLDFVTQLKPGQITDTELTQIASALYGTVLQTNFLVNERSIGTEIPVSAPLGQEAAINRSLGVDFVFTNINDSLFTLNLSAEGNTLTASLTGFPFVYDYRIKTGSEEKLEPRLIKQFSAFVNSGKIVEEEGSEGKRVEVLRSILENDMEIEVETVSTDYYPPVHRIEVYPLAEPAAETPPATETETELPADENGTAVEVDENGNPVTPEPNTVVPGEEETVNETDKDGNVFTQPEQKDPIYDKGGNLIDP